MTETEAKTEIRRGTIFGREAINRNDLLKALVVDGQDKVRLDDIQNYVNKSQQQAQHLGWYKFAALFGFIIIILQALTTFGVVLWGDGVTRQLYEQDGMMTGATGAPLDTSGLLHSGQPLTAANIYQMYDEGIVLERIKGLVLEDSDGAAVEFNFNFGGFSSSEDAFALYTTTGAVIVVTEDTLTATIGGSTYVQHAETRRRLSAPDHGICDLCNPDLAGAGAQTDASVCDSKAGCDGAGITCTTGGVKRSCWKWSVSGCYPTDADENNTDPCDDYTFQGSCEMVQTWVDIWSTGSSWQQNIYAKRASEGSCKWVAAGEVYYQAS